jgi:hypothetical protein
MSFLKKIALVCLSIAVLYPVALLFGIVKPALFIGITGLIIKFFNGDEVKLFPLLFAVAEAFSVTTISYISNICPVPKIPVIPLALVVTGIFVIIEYRTKRKYLWLTRAVVVPIIPACIIWPEVWAVNLFFYGSLLQALRLPEWTSRGMGLLDEVLIRYCRIVKKNVNVNIKGD